MYSLDPSEKGRNKMNLHQSLVSITNQSTAYPSPKNELFIKNTAQGAAEASKQGSIQIKFCNRG
jgi:hypothetical protein